MATLGGWEFIIQQLRSRRLPLKSFDTEPLIHRSQIIKTPTIKSLQNQQHPHATENIYLANKFIRKSIPQAARPQPESGVD